MTKLNYRMFDVAGRPVSNQDLQDKGAWCAHGESIEHVFVERYGGKLHVAINPEKAADKFALDLINTKHNILSDLKTQNTPFFRSEALYGIDPQFAVTFNQKDAIRYTNYLESFGEILIYFWVDWLAVRWELGDKSIEVSHMTGVWGIRFSNLKTILEGQSLHEYLQRKNDQKGNARSSYVLDLRHEKIWKTGLIGLWNYPGK